MPRSRPRSKAGWRRPAPPRRRRRPRARDRRAGAPRQRLWRHLQARSRQLSAHLAEVIAPALAGRLTPRAAADAVASARVAAFADPEGERSRGPWRRSPPHRRHASRRRVVIISAALAILMPALLLRVCRDRSDRRCRSDRATGCWPGHRSWARIRSFRPDGTRAKTDAEDMRQFGAIGTQQATACAHGDAIVGGCQGQPLARRSEDRHCRRRGSRSTARPALPHRSPRAIEPGRSRCSGWIAIRCSATTCSQRAMRRRDVAAMATQSAHAIDPARTSADA